MVLDPRSPRCDPALMRMGPSWLVAMVCLGSAACGAADDRVDPGDLALRDLLGVMPQVVAGWDEAQRAAARQVLAAGLTAGPEMVLLAPLADDEAALVRAVAVSDAALDDRGEDARGLVVVSAPRTELRVVAGPQATALLEAATAPPAVELVAVPRAWPCPAAPCDLAVLAALAADAAPDAAAVRVQPVAQLAVIAALTDGPDGAPTLLVNPVVTAVGVPIGLDRAGPGGAAGAGGTSDEPAAASIAPPPLVRGSWTYGATRDGCASQVAADCTTCLSGGLCEPVWPSVSGMQACTTLAADAPRNYELVCVNLAVSLADVRACLQDRAPSCAIDVDAIDLPAELTNNAVFVDDGGCRSALDDCLAQLYGAGDGGGDGCGACDGCDCDSGGDPNVDNSGCNDDGCNGGSCSGGDCGGNGGDCGGGGGGGSCQVAGPTRRGPGLGVALAWVLLPVPVALRAQRRARSAARRAAAAPP